MDQGSDPRKARNAKSISKWRVNDAAFKLAIAFGANPEIFATASRNCLEGTVCYRVGFAQGGDAGLGCCDLGLKCGYLGFKRTDFA